jgi:predicted nucleic acid-binding protein
VDIANDNAVDTNIFEALWSGTPQLTSAARQSLERANAQGPVVIAPPVFAELAAAPGRDLKAIEIFLDRTHIEVDWALEQSVWRTAASAFSRYAERRRKQGRDPGPRRILADFIIGAHAVHLATALLTFDQGIYRAAFPSLTVIVPGR